MEPRLRTYDLEQVVVVVKTVKSELVSRALINFLLVEIKMFVTFLCLFVAVNKNMFSIAQFGAKSLLLYVITKWWYFYLTLMKSFQETRPILMQDLCFSN